MAENHQVFLFGLLYNVRERALEVRWTSAQRRPQRSVERPLGFKSSADDL